MSEVETVALWVGLIAGVVSIVLAIVAIWFSVWVNGRATEVSDQTIRSLQRIEATVERQSGDTQQLIKAAWDKMLGGVPPSPSLPAVSDSNADKLASGVVAELKADLAGEAPDTAAPVTTKEMQEQLDRVFQRLERTIATQLKRAESQEQPRRQLDLVVDSIRTLSPAARALVEALRGHHLSRPVYRKLAANPSLRNALMELRERGIIVPLTGYESDEASGTARPGPVYWFPSEEMAKVYSAALMLLPPVPPSVRNSVLADLARAGAQLEPPDNREHESGEDEKQG